MEAIDPNTKTAALDASVVVYLDHDPSGMPWLHSGTTNREAESSKVQYLSEGGANFVFRLVPRDGAVLPSPLKGHLLRLRKDLPHIASAIQQFEDHENNIKPLVPSEHLVEHRLIRLDQSVIEALDNALMQLHHHPLRRAEHSLTQSEEYGMLITDMSVRAERGEKMFEIKPKWLAQSPSAPPDSKRCRTCALRARRQSEKDQRLTHLGICPLALVSEDEQIRQKAAQSLVDDERVGDYLVKEGQALLQLIREIQQQQDPGGVSNFVPNVDQESQNDNALLNICRAMTFRDCTLFIRKGARIEARLGDLDLKQATKLSNWQQVERSLVDEGWYTNTESKAWSRETGCLLSQRDDTNVR